VVSAVVGKSPGRRLDSFRPRVLWQLTNCLLGLFIAGITIGIVADYLTPLSIAIGAVVAPIGVLIAVRAWLARVEYSKTEVLVYGLLWSRTINRSRIVDVDTSPWLPIVAWETRRGVLWFTPMTVLAIGRTIVPLSMFSRTTSFLSRLSSWSG
jgi:hypothetical protein